MRPIQQLGRHLRSLEKPSNEICPYKLRQKFGIAIFSEGWGLYNETLMHETGFFPDERIHLRQLQLRLWRIARVVWDVGLNTGKLSYDECVSLLVDGVGFLRWAAELEVDGSATGEHAAGVDARGADAELSLRSFQGINVA
jgi:uncharacterized protein (DUF885 family)